MHGQGVQYRLPAVDLSSGVCQVLGREAQNEPTDLRDGGLRSSRSADGTGPVAGDALAVPSKGCRVTSQLLLDERGLII